MLYKKFGTATAMVLLFGMGVGAEPGPQRYWLAGRYDGNRVVVFFDAVKFGKTFPSDAVEISAPATAGFFAPLVLNARTIAGLRRGPDAEHFAVGDRYDLLLGTAVMTITLTALVGYPGDEDVGNDSYIGALATVDQKGGFLSGNDYYVVTRHSKDGAEVRAAGDARLVQEPVPFDVQVQIAARLNERRKATSAPAFKIQPFTIADGTLRYYVRAQWKANDKDAGFGAWMSPSPKVHISAVQKQTSNYGFDEKFPRLCNVLDLGGGKTGVIVLITGEDGYALRLVEYRDGVDLANMRTLHEIGSGE